MSTTPQQGASGPPPKPWERSGSSSGPAPFRPPSAGATSEVVEASGTARPGEIVSTSDRTAAVNTNAVGRPLPTRPWENPVGTSSIGGYNSGLGYNSGGFGSGMYNSYGGGYGGMSGGMYGGSSMYRGGYGAGGGMYGGGMYGGGMYGGGGLGGTMGGMGGLGGMGGMGGMGGYGMGMGGPLGPQDPNNAPASPPGFWISFLRVMEGVVSFFGRVSLLVDQNTQAVHFFMTALLQLFDRGGMLYGELARFVFRILGRKARKIAAPVGPNGLPLPGPEMQNGQKLLEGPKAASAGSWDNVWGNDGRR